MDEVDKDFLRTRDWCGRDVTCWDGDEYFDEWEFCEDFPWIVNAMTGRGLEFVSNDWRLDEDGEWELLQIGVKLDDLIDFYIESQLEQVGGEKPFNETTQAIECLRKQIEKLEVHLKILVDNTK